MKISAALISTLAPTAECTVAAIAWMHTSQKAIGATLTPPLNLFILILPAEAISFSTTIASERALLL
jgi:hypothetical protein